MISGTGHKISMSNDTQSGNQLFEPLDSDMILIKWIKKLTIHKQTGIFSKKIKLI